MTFVPTPQNRRFARGSSAGPRDKLPDKDTQKIAAQSTLCRGGSIPCEARPSLLGSAMYEAGKRRAIRIEAPQAPVADRGTS